MKISMEEISPQLEEEILIKCHQVDEEIMNLVKTIKVAQHRITGIIDDKYYSVPLEAVYYYETVDSKAFFYTKDKVFETKLKLYQFEQEFGGDKFFRASKSAIVNVTKIAFVKPYLSGRFEATLANKEKVIISRQYVGDMKKLLGM